MEADNMTDLQKPKQQKSRAAFGRKPGYAKELTRQYSFGRNFSTAPAKSNEDAFIDKMITPLNVVVGGLSELVESVTPLDKNDMDDMQKAILPSRMYEDYKAHETGYQMSGSFAGLLVPAILVPKIMQAPKVANAVEKLVGARATSMILVRGGSIADRVKRIKTASGISAANQFKTISKTGNPVLAAALKNEIWGATADAIKIGAATDATIFAMFNESDTLFPESLSAAENAAMYGIPTLAIGGIVGAFTRRKLQHVANKIHATKGIRELNKANLPVYEMLSVVGDRGASITMLNAMKRMKESEYAAAAGNTALQTNINSQIVSFDYAVASNLMKMGEDTAYPGITVKYEIKDNEKNTVLNALRDDDAALEGVVSIQELKSGYTDADFLTQAKRTRTVLETKKEKLKIEISTAGGAKQRDLLTEQYDELTAQQKDIDEMFAFVQNTDGSKQLLAHYKPSFSDTATGTIKKTTENNLVDKLQDSHAGDVFKVEMEKEGQTAFAVKFKQEDSESYAMVSDDLKIIMPGQVLGAETKKDVKIILDSVSEADKHTMQSLLDIGKVYHYKSGQLGAVITANLTPKTQKLLQSWTGTSVNHPFRTGADGGKEALEELYKMNERVRTSLREVAGPDGLIPLFRGELEELTVNPADDLVSMSSRPKTAEKFGDKLTLTYVDPEDVVAVVGGKGDEFEYIVRGNLKRSVGQEISNKAFSDLNYAGKTAIQHAGRLAVEAWNPTTAKTINVSASMHHTEIDLLLALKDKFGEASSAVTNKIKFSKTVRSWEDLEYLSASSKYRDYVAEMDKAIQAEKGLLNLSPAQRTTQDDIIKTLNLPNDGVYGAEPMTQIFNSLYVQGFKDLGEQIPTFNKLQKEIRQARDLKSELLGEFADRKMVTSGTQYVPITEPRKPVLLIGKSAYENPYSVDDYWLQAAEQRTAQMVRFDQAAKRGDAELIELIRAETMHDPVRLAMAKQVGLLVEGTQARRGAFEAGVQTMDAVNNQPVIFALDSIRDQADKITQRYIARIFEDSSPIQQRIRSVNHKGDLLSFNIARHQVGQGWRGIEIETVDGVSRLRLEDHAYNRELFAELYPNVEMPKKLYLPEPKAKVDSQYAPLQFSELAAQVLADYDKLSQSALSHLNELRRLSKLPPLARRPFHLPAKNLKDQEHVILLDAETRAYKGVVSGNTSLHARKNADQEIAAAKGKGINLISATEADLANYQHMELEMLTGMSDYSTTLRQDGTAKGLSFGSVIETGPEVLDAMNDSLIRQYTQISRITSAILFEPELRAAELALRSSGLTPKEINKGLTIWSQYKNRALGLKSQNKNQFIGQVYGAVEDAWDTVLNNLWDVKVQALTGKVSQQQARYEYAELGKAVPDYNPIKDMEQYVATTMKIKAPHTMVKNMMQLNNLAGLTMLRMFETGLALVNLGTLPSLIPVVAKALARQKGQSVEEWKNANAAWGAIIDNNTIIWSPTKTFTSGMHYMFTKEGRTALEEAAKKGNLKQEVVERMQDITAPSIGYTENMLRKGLKVTTFLVDKSEQLSRSISYLSFHNMAVKNLKMKGDEAHEFAHQMANRTIGDFRPNNKPRIFQGATGAPFGLFTTFAYNYLQRVFGYLEKGQFDVFFQQMGLQASLFGAKSLPGFNQYVENFTSNYDGSETMVDRMRKSVGEEATEYLLFGGVGTLTGWAAYTRTDIRLPGSNFAYSDSVFDLAPAVGMIKKTFGGIAETIQAANSNSGLSSARLSEIASRTFPIKGIRGYIDLAQGYRVDSRGQVIDEEIEGASEVMARMASVKTTRDQLLMEEFSRQKNTELKQRAVRHQSRQALRSAFRAGKLDSSTFKGTLKDYIKSGGDPSDLPNFILEQAKFGLINKGFLKALSIAGDVSKQDDFLRLINIVADRDQLAPD